MLEEILKKILKLSYFDLKKESFEKILADFQTIVRYVEKIKSARITKEEPFFHFKENIESLREDKEDFRDEELTEKLLKEAPLKENRFFKTKKIL